MSNGLGLIRLSLDFIFSLIYTFYYMKRVVGIDIIAVELFLFPIVGMLVTRHGPNVFSIAGTIVCWSGSYLLFKRDKRGIKAAHILSIVFSFVGLLCLSFYLIAFFGKMLMPGDYQMLLIGGIFLAFGLFPTIYLALPKIKKQFA